MKPLSLLALMATAILSAAPASAQAPAPAAPYYRGTLPSWVPTTLPPGSAGITIPDPPPPPPQPPIPPMRAWGR
ncbi:MAG TPA: hypothetical protein VNO55_19755 [Polyangia bacterium]|nr:hypothetical protein [Polyangia bacterium]